MLVWQAHKGKIESMAFAADGSLLATATGGTRTVHLWEPTTGKLVRKLTADWPDGRTLEQVKSVAFAPDAPLFAAGTSRSVTVWCTDTWEPVADLGRPDGLGYAYGFYEMAFAPGERPVLAASDAGETGLWDDAGHPTGEKVRPADRRISLRGIAALDFSPDGTLLAGINHLQAGVWKTATAAQIRVLHRPRGNHRGAVRFSPDGSRLAMARGKYVDLWATAGGEHPAATIEAGIGRQPAVWALGWSSGGDVLMSAGADGSVRFWDAANGTEVRSIEWGIGKLYCAAFSPDGLTCAAGGENGQVVVWDVDA